MSQPKKQTELLFAAVLNDAAQRHRAGLRQDLARICTDYAARGIVVEAGTPVAVQWARVVQYLEVVARDAMAEFEKRAVRDAETLQYLRRAASEQLEAGLNREAEQARLLVRERNADPKQPANAALVAHSQASARLQVLRRTWEVAMGTSQPGPPTPSAPTAQGDSIAVIVTAKECEFEAVRARLTNLREEVHKGTVFDVGTFSADGAVWRIALAQAGQGNSTAAACTERAIAVYQPDAALFVGIAGGVKDVKLGDVVAAEKVYGYERGKDLRRFKPRPDVAASAHDMVERARAEARAVNRAGATGYNTIVAPIAAGEKVVASTRSLTSKFLADNYGDAVAVEMEGRGFLEAVSANHSVRGLVVRGISDLLSGKSAADRTGSQERASKNAADFAFRVLSGYSKGATPVVVASRSVISVEGAAPNLQAGEDERYTRFILRMRRDLLSVSGGLSMPKNDPDADLALRAQAQGDLDVMVFATTLSLHPPNTFDRDA